MPNYRWKQIVARYPNQQNIIDLYNSKQMKELVELWDCSVDCVRTIRDKLGLHKKNISQIELIEIYSKEQLEDLYFNKYDRHLLKMAEGLNVYYDTLTQLFEHLGIEQKPHHMSEYPGVIENLRHKALKRAEIKNPIDNILQDPNWNKKAVQSRKDNGSYTSPEYRAKISKKHVEVLERGEHKFRNTDIEVILQKELTKRGIKFIQDKGLINLTVPDMFIEPNIAVYADGDYWHSLPKALVKDKYINEGLRRAGYKVFRFLGSEIKKDVSACVDQIEAYVNGQKSK
jgi:DNA mismatch endonuclease (patch repair protein)